MAELPGGRKAESARYVVAYRPNADPVAVGKPFVLDVVACAKGGAAAPEKLAVDAHMPEHRHGMNYRPVVKAAGSGKFRAEGLMFHMPDRDEAIGALG